MRRQRIVLVQEYTFKSNFAEIPIYALIHFWYFDQDRSIIVGLRLTVNFNQVFGGGRYTKVPANNKSTYQNLLIVARGTWNLYSFQLKFLNIQMILFLFFQQLITDKRQVLRILNLYKTYFTKCQHSKGMRQVRQKYNMAEGNDFAD